MSTGPRAYALTAKAYRYLDMFGDAKAPLHTPSPHVKRPCSVCGRSLAILRTGNVRRHLHDGDWCLGGNRSPAQPSTSEVSTS